MNKKWSVLPAFAGALLGLMSCYPGEVTNIQQLDIVVTAHDDTVSFTSFVTYAVLDSVVHIDLEDNANDDLLNRDNDDQILARVHANMQTLGYVQELDPATNTSDILVLVGAVAIEKDAYFTYGWWDWYGWYPYYPCCYGPGYGWGYPVTGSVSYGVGTLVMTILDPTRDGPGMTAPILWVGAVNGLLEGVDAGTPARIVSAIDQAFDQSPYLSAN